jgi:SOS-response transcriptional repressor LexA
VLAYVQATIAEYGRAPSYGMIRDALGFTDKSDVRRVVRRLEKRGLLMRVGSGRVRSGSDWNKPVLRLCI